MVPVAVLLATALIIWDIEYGIQASGESIERLAHPNDTEIKLADEISPHVLATLNQLSGNLRTFCPRTDDCSSKGGTCKALAVCYKERGTRYYCCTGEHVSSNSENCECCVPDGCPELSPQPCLDAGGMCRKYCLSEEELLDISCNAGLCKCCKPESITRPSPAVCANCRHGTCTGPDECTCDPGWTDDSCTTKCKPKGNAKKKCKRSNGVCQPKSEQCSGQIIKKGCKGKGCRCCAPLE